MQRKVEDFWHFSRRYRQFTRVSGLSAGLLAMNHELSDTARDALRRLNDRRVACQAGIAALNLPEVARCGACHGACCREPTDHYFTAIDFWLRRGTPGRVPGYRPVQPLPLHRYYATRIAAALDFRRPKPLPSEGTGTGSEQRCAYLGEQGCLLPHEERPVKCLIYACQGMKRSLDRDTRLTYLKAVRELHRISLETFHVLKLEAGLPPHYGVASLFFTL